MQIEKLFVGKRLTNLKKYKNSIDSECPNMLIYTLSIEICGCGGTGRRAGLRNQCQRRGGSSPLIRTNDVSVRTKLNREIQKSISKMVDFFFLQKIILILYGKDGTWYEDN